jgi:hypothetical protein
MKPTPTAIGVRAVLAGVYRAGALDRRAPLTHAIALDAAGNELHLLCAGVRSVDHLCDVAEKGPPTCPTCARRAAK